MTKKHFAAIARAFFNSKPEPDSLEAMSTWIACVMNTSYELASFNPRFDKLTFWKACGYEYTIQL